MAGLIIFPACAAYGIEAGQGIKPDLHHAAECI